MGAYLPAARLKSAGIAVGSMSGPRTVMLINHPGPMIISARSCNEHLRLTAWK